MGNVSFSAYMEFLIVKYRSITVLVVFIYEFFLACFCNYFGPSWPEVVAQSKRLLNASSKLAFEYSASLISHARFD